jgi:hemerythrin superfamily protein
MENQANVGNDLVRIHKVITRALNVALQNTRDARIPEKHRSGFILYVRSLTILLHAHHSGEDELAFPFWKVHFPEGPFDELGRQHRQISDQIERIEQWMQSENDLWNSEVLNDLYHAFADLNKIWEIHVSLEEETIGPDKSRQYLSPSENELLGKQLSEHGQAHSQPGELVMPFIVYNLSGADRIEFVKLLPPVVTNQLIPVAWKAAWEPMIPFLQME